MNMMAYILLSTVLGITIMLLPLLVFTPPLNGPSGVFSTDAIERFSAAQTLGKEDVGSVPFSSSVTHVGLIVIISLIIALSTYVYTNKRISFN